MPRDIVREAQLAELRQTWVKLENAVSQPLETNHFLLMADHHLHQQQQQQSSPPPTSTPKPAASSTPLPATVASATGLSRASASTPPPASGSGNTTASGSGSAVLGVSRRTHPKSRTGCRTCKIRKIKCDEERPSCRNCIKHGVTCPYITPSSSATTPSGTISAAASPIPASLLLPHGLSGLHGDHDLNLVDLELLHNFTTSTYATLSSDPSVRNVWRITVARFGVQCEYVMRSILAVSALHIAHHKPQKRDFYFSRALAYHQLASRAATPLMTSLATSNEGWDEAFPPWIFLLSGSKSLICLSSMRIEEYDGPLSPLFIHGKRRWDMYYDRKCSPTLQREISELEQRITSTVMDPVARTIYVSIIHDLARNIKAFKSTDVPYMPDITDPFVWVYSDLGPFLVHLRAQTQESIVIMAHFAVMIRSLENHWWLEGWSFLLLAKAWDMLDEEHKLWIQWPLEQVGWIPP
ncbi:hypothetical protein Cpir12675_000545 [Ceratocystis pirilliformis]|uniref:Zn(2)-C6 fungal-type domain-containing protein n=1 Tax=Ceratocystis pirilliformis TaxID=259994 RepID=A0ABR3ZM23_9PEZI